MGADNCEMKKHGKTWPKNTICMYSQLTNCKFAENAVENEAKTNKNQNTITR